jgi:quinol monooxygenase YgiN
VAFVVSAHWRAKQGEEDRIARIIEEMTPLSRAEPGCLYYQAHRSPDDGQLFYLYEQYVDESGYEAHMDSEHFTRLVKQEAIPNLESRDRAFFTTMG